MKRTQRHQHLVVCYLGDMDSDGRFYRMAYGAAVSHDNMTRFSISFTVFIHLSSMMLDKGIFVLWRNCEYIKSHERIECEYTLLAQASKILDQSFVLVHIQPLHILGLCFFFKFYSAVHIIWPPLPLYAIQQYHILSMATRNLLNLDDDVKPLHPNDDACLLMLDLDNFSFVSPDSFGHNLSCARKSLGSAEKRTEKN